MNQFNFTAILQSIIDAAGTFYGIVRGPAAALLLSVSTCLSVGCGPYKWQAKKVKTTMGTQFEMGYVSESKIIIGFPGQVEATGSADGSGDGTPKPMPTEMK